MVHNTFAGTYYEHSSCCIAPCREGKLECMGNCIHDYTLKCVHILTGSKHAVDPSDTSHSGQNIYDHNPTVYHMVLYTQRCWCHESKEYYQDVHMAVFSPQAQSILRYMFLNRVLGNNDHRLAVFYIDLCKHKLTHLGDRAF